MRTVPRMLAAALGAVVALTALTACSSPAAKPADLAVKVFQLRSDYAIRGAQIEITNRGSSDLTITSATFTSDWFAKTVSSPSAPNPLAAKGTVDFRVVLAAGRCDAAKAAPVVHLRYTRKDGSSGSATVTPAIPFQSLSVVHGQDCSRQEFEKVAKITIAPTLRFDPPIPTGDADTGQHAALIDVTFTPTGATGSVTLHGTEDTTLLQQREGTLRTFDLTLTAASAPTTVTLDYIPTGCEQHRIAEDKIGTLIPMHVDAGAYTDVLFLVPVSLAMKNALMDWVGVYCGW